MSSASDGFRVIRNAAEYSDGMNSIAWSANIAWSAMPAPYPGAPGLHPPVTGA
ncbi:MAG: hypothetical protein NVSMB16_00890 [Acidimicrobiales bacterium]